MIATGSTVTVPASAPAFITLSNLKVLLGIEGTDTDARLTALIGQASAMIEAWCGYRFGVETIEDRFVVTKRDDSLGPLILRKAPVIDGSVTVSEDGVELDPSAIEIEYGTGMIWPVDDQYRSAWSGNRVTVTYDAGYSVIPTVVSTACAYAVGTMVHSMQRDGTIKVAWIEGVMREEYFDTSSKVDASGLPMNARSLLRPYKRVVI